VIHNLFQFGFAGLAGICLLAALLRRAQRASLLTAAASAGSAALAAHNDAFWVLVVFGLGSVWALVTATRFIDLAWRVKTGFVVFLALGAALCIYPTYHDEIHGRDATATTMGAPGSDQLNEQETETRLGRGKTSFGAYLRANIPFRLVRGLDLKGGLRLVYTVDVDEAIKDKRDRYYDELRAALTTAFGFHQGDKPPSVDELSKLPTKVSIAKSKDQAGTITLAFNDPADSKKVDDAFLKRFLAELTMARAPDGKKITFRIRSEVESNIRDSAVSQAKETVRRRIDELGLKDPSLTVRDEDIIIEVPGEDEREFSRMRDTISQVARLEFKMVDDDVDFFAAAAKSDDVPKSITFPIENAPVGKSENGETRSRANHYARITKGENESMPEALERFKTWINRPSRTVEGALEMPIDADHEIGYQKLLEYDEQKDSFEEIGWRTYYLFSKAEITGDMVREASAQPDQSDRGLGGWHVLMTMTPVGGDRFEEITGSHIKRRFAIILDGKVESAPVIQGKIGGGVATISMGSGNPEQQLADSRKLELVLKSGALPAPISPSSQQRIGASLGQDAIVQGGKGAVAGIVMVLLFMVVYYNRAGVIADVAVLFNLVLQVAILAMMGASMTLPGICGLTLTIGIAVDANVLINERIREELRHGKTPRAAVDIGYDKAFSAIIDGHATTLIAGLILWQYGSGPIKGFAVTLFIGVLASLFTGVVCTRLMFDWAVRARKVKNLHLG
jgi:preprotein translocase subunit SecD